MTTQAEDEHSLDEHLDVNAERTFNENIDAIFQPFIDKVDAPILEDKKLYVEYLKAGLTQDAFSVKRGYDKNKIRNLLRKYNLPAGELLPAVARKSLAKARRILTLGVLGNCDCVGSKILRQTLEAEKNADNRH